MTRLPIVFLIVLFSVATGTAQQQFSPKTFTCASDTAHLVWDRALYHVALKSHMVIVGLTDSTIVTRTNTKHLAGLVITRTRQGKLVLHTIRGVGGGGDSGFDYSYETEAAEMALRYMQFGPVKK